MQSHTRALIAASAYSVITGKKAAGLYDHALGEHRRIAAECRGNRVQGVDGDRSATFGGTLPELYDDGDKAFISLEIEGSGARGYDRGTQGHYTVEVADPVIRVYDYGAASWFAFEVQLADGAAPPSVEKFPAAPK